ncbi:MAG TPA: hypothetical protein VMM93_14585 [Vicinamibacterales bacterium]|nr:hypothetical protein [Vicinamibacterales bacterium]
MSVHRSRRRATSRTVAAEPLTAFELVTRRAVEDLERELGRIDTKVNALVVGMFVTVVAEVWRTSAWKLAWQPPAPTGVVSPQANQEWTRW